MKPREEFRAIADYGMISDCNTAALADRSGSIDWLCLPRYDSASIFARLLDPLAGHWSITPAAPFETSRRYLPGTLVLETTFSTRGGEARLIDAMTFPEGQRGHQLGLDAPHEVLRMIEGISGEVEFLMECSPRTEYGLGRPLFREAEYGALSFGGPDRVGISSSVPLELREADVLARFAARAGDRVGFALRWGSVERPEPEPTPAGEVPARMEDVMEGWRSWEADHQNYAGRYGDLVTFSTRVLKGLTYRPTGAIVAAPTTSLPETVGGERNWDYRYSWIRDASLTFEAFWVGACPDEIVDFVSWMAMAAGGHVYEHLPLQIMHGVRGERYLAERELDHLRGWRDSRPVRIGNGAWTQTQLDVYGEFLSVLELYRARMGDIDSAVQHFAVDLADEAARCWRDPDAGIWEMRAEPRHHLSSKLLCWVALDRAVKLAPHIGAESRVDDWATERDAIRQAIMSSGWSERRKAFAQSFGSDDLDASALLMPIYGFLPATDERIRSTIAAVEEHLTRNGLVFRYLTADGLSGEEGAFVICSFWLVSCLALAGEVGRAQELFDGLVGRANDLGLLAEEVHPDTGELLGNFPQAFSHIGLINAAWEIDQALERSRR